MVADIISWYGNVVSKFDFRLLDFVIDRLFIKVQLKRTALKLSVLAILGLPKIFGD